MSPFNKRCTKTEKWGVYSRIIGNTSAQISINTLQTINDSISPQKKNERARLLNLKLKTSLWFTFYLEMIYGNFCDF